MKESYRIGRTITLFTSASHFMIHSYEFIFPSVLVMVGFEWGIDYGLLGLLANASYLAIGLGSLPAGMISDRLGSKRTMMIYLIGAASSSIFIALSQSIFSLAFGLILLGVFLSIYHPAGLSLISQQAKDIGPSFGVHGMTGNLGMALAPLMAGLMAASYGWRSSYLFFAIPGMALASLLPFLKMKKKEGQVSAALFEGMEFDRPQRGEDNKRLLILSFVGIMFAGFCYRGATTFLPAYVSQNVSHLFSGWFPLYQLHQGVAKGGFLTTIILLVGVLGQYMGGQLTKKIKTEILYALLMALSIPFIVLMGLFSDFPLVLFASLFAFFQFSSQPVGNVLISTFSPSRRRGLTFGLSFFLTFSFGSFAASFCGFLGQRFGLSYVFLFLGGLSIIPIALALLIYLWHKSA